MGVAMNAISKFNAALGGAAMTASHITSKAGKQNKETNTAARDAEMAEKARKTASAKLEAIYSNKELSRKAMTRRRNQVLKELQEGGR